MNSLMVAEVCSVLEYKNGELVWKASTGPGCKKGDFAGRAIAANGYRTVSLFGKSYKAHRLIYFMFNGEFAAEIDHINGVRHDNRIENLRPVTRSQNCANQQTQKRSKTGLKGVSYMPKLQKWRARIKVMQKEIYLGVFPTKEDAAQAYNISALHHFGEFARTNKVEVAQ